MKHSLFIRPLFKEDWKSIKEIYKAGIETDKATFETNIPKWKKWKKTHLLPCCLVAQSFDTIVGFAALSPTSHREVYKGVAEVSVYIAPDYQRKSIGTILLNSLISLSEEQGFWTLQASIFPENNASIKLHESCGFRSVGIRERIGKLNGSWHDNILMERRSQNIN